ncbi:hypothetical protein [Rheinheimera hassiensis]|jgi:hypothetical protein|uniref:hypothetical protein n=1 Tax=Rheinheimera hassiensis TaxID=1193627 RepID=UPI001F06EFB5|nr:hypothetical protein [Rheinheimera hassiensis]
MNKVISLLETLGQNAALQSLDTAALQKVFNPLDMDVQVQQAILSRDHVQLEALLQVRNKVICAICPAEEPPQDVPENDDETEEKSSVAANF